MIEAIITDLDDTLLRRDKTISEFTVKILKQCRQKGIKLMLATGRGDSAKQFVPFELFDGYVLMNGAIAVADNQKIFKKLIAPEVFVPFLNEMTRANIYAAAEINGVHYSNFDVPNRKHVISHFDSIKEMSEKLYVIVDSPDKLKIVKKALSEKLYAHFTRDNYALITNFEARKINAVTAMLKFWNIPFSESVAFGDDTNDRDMIEKCGIGVAMDNALDEIKIIANEICGDCDNDGVAKWVSERIV